MRAVIDISYNYKWANVHYWDDPGGYIGDDYKERRPGESVADFQDRLEEYVEDQSLIDEYKFDDVDIV